MNLNIKQRISLILAILIVAIGGVIAFLPQKVMQQNLDKSQKVVRSKQAVQKLQAENKVGQKQKPTYDFSKVSPISYRLAQQAPNTVLNYHQGMIKIPSANVRAVINEGVSDQSLISGVGTMKPNQVMGQKNYALAGHNNYDYGQNGFLFSTLKRISKGDNIYLTNFKNVYVYRAFEKRIINNSDGSVINDDQVKAGAKPIVTMITCYSTSHESHPKTRLLVQGELIGQYQLKGEF